MTKVRIATVCALATALSVVTVVSAVAQTTTTLAPATPVKVNPKGVGTPPPGSGIGSQAALKNPKCNADAIKGYGVFPLVTETDGPFCVVPAPNDNGGATYRGVTADSITVVVVVPNAAQLASLKAQSGALPRNIATGGTGSYEAAWLDTWAPYEHVYETWGRKVNFKFVTSTGNDEAAQRADAIAVKQEKPMFVVDSVASGLRVLESVLAQDKYIVEGYGTTTDDAIKQPGYRWGSNDLSASFVNTAEFVGKQLAKGKAVNAGDTAMHSQARKFGVIVPSDVNTDLLVAQLKKQGVPLVMAPLGYTANGSPTGDPVVAQQEAPAIISKFKDAGVTSVILFTDLGMTGALTHIAAQQQFSPEWVITGYQYQDISIIARNYDQDEWAHAFGISNLPPGFKNASSLTGPDKWYWGAGQGTQDPPTASKVLWLASAIQYAGPTLNPKNVQRGFFAMPARYGAASDDAAGLQIAYGKTAQLPAPSYFQRGSDFAAVWYDPTTKGESQVYPTSGQGVTWYTSAGKRYTGGTWPTKPIKFFDKTGAIFAFDTLPHPPGPAVPCTGCPSEGGTATPSTG